LSHQTFVSRHRSSFYPKQPTNTNTIAFLPFTIFPPPSSLPQTQSSNQDSNMVRSLLLAALAAAGSNGFSSTPHLGHPSAKPSIRPAMRLQYAALEDPMSKADSTKSGCPFLIQKYEFRTFDVPALFGAGECMYCL
jgi:hypothetical protein